MIWFDVRDCRQIIFVTLNRFYTLSKKPSTLFLTENIKRMEYQPRKWKIHPLFTLLFQVLRVVLKKNHKIASYLQPPNLLSFYIYWHHLSLIFRTSFNLTWKKNFVINFPFLTEFTQRSASPPQRPKSDKLAGWQCCY